MFLLPTALAQTVTPQTVDTTLYLHPLGLQDFPINTQTPQRSTLFDGVGFGLTFVTLTCIGATTGTLTGGLTSQAFSTFYGYSTLSFVAYDRTSSAGDPMVHPQRGLTYNTTVVGTPMLHWAMTPVESAMQHPGGAVNVVVDAQIRAPDGLSLDDRGYDTGPLLMSGQTEPVTLLGTTVAGSGASQVTTTEVNGQVVYLFTIPLQVQDPVIPQAAGFTLRVDVRMDVPGCTPGTSIMPGVLEPYGGDGLWSRITLRNGDPLRIEPLRMEAGRGNITFHTNATSVWGAYDVLVPNATLTVTGPAQTTGELRETVWRTVEHFHLTDPVLQTWVLDTRDLPDGAYSAVYRVSNLQGTAVAESTVTFILNDGQMQTGPPRQAPIPIAIPGVALLIGLLVRRLGSGKQPTP